MQGNPLDPISQMIGALGAQVTNYGAQLTDLRSEILLNRTEADKRWVRFEEGMDKIYAEYRTVKHLERSMELNNIAIDSTLRDIKERLRKLEDIALMWRVRAGVAIIAGTVIGTVILYLIQSVLRKWVG